ncbi:NAD(P)-dependent oxidoreductase [Devosia pacifica]|uniref:NAD(P)-dependent oxidoreductase n=1 Tax=Devosia pacifica TaxID=1335967 RepID=A0A918S398_9HYPH|nr:NAD(P)-dependent oxidoreductase [Devosia pacifica]GHA22914.1 NAD(P)-dependent oxidoreductase [Devosia pacifica]
MSVLFLGMGYSAWATHTELRQADGQLDFAATARSEEAVRRLEQAEIEPHWFDGQTPGPSLPGALSRSRQIISSIAPTASGDPVLTRHRGDFAMAEELEWMCYYSTVGVYGDAGGDWVDEGVVPDPVNERSQWRIEAEDKWRALADERRVPLLVLRLAGIYGPQRSSFDKLRRGTAKRIIKPAQVFNRIHVADIARVTALAAERRLAGTLNLADDEPAPPQDVVTHAAQLLDIAPPPEVAFEEADMSPMARSFYADNKRVSNAAIKSALGIELLFPTYREGLEAIRREETLQ